MSLRETQNQPDEFCANAAGYRLRHPRKMMFATGEAFEYLECGHCGCLQTATMPDNLVRHYPNDGYHSCQLLPQKKHSAWILRLRAERARAYLGYGSPIGKALVLVSKEPEHFQWFWRGAVKLGSRIVEEDD